MYCAREQSTNLMEKAAKDSQSPIKRNGLFHIPDFIAVHYNVTFYSVFSQTE